MIFEALVITYGRTHPLGKLRRTFVSAAEHRFSKVNPQFRRQLNQRDEGNVSRFLVYFQEEI